MDTSGALTQSGLLWEGNYAGWRTRMDSVLDIHGYHDFKYSCAISRRCTQCSGWPEAYQLMKSQISPALLNRVPPRRQRCPCLLWRSLDRLCQPFRLMDLPDEVRPLIYNLALNTTSGLHPLTLASQQIRVETGPFWIPRYRFKLSFPHDDLLVPSVFASRIRSWAQSLGSHNLKHLRHVELLYYGQGPEASKVLTKLALRCSPGEGLWVSGWASDGCVGALQATLDHLEPYIKNVEADRRLLGLSGEAILQGFTMQAPFWVEAYAAWLCVVETSAGGRQRGRELSV